MDENKNYSVLKEEELEININKDAIMGLLYKKKPTKEEEQKKLETIIGEIENRINKLSLSIKTIIHFPINKNNNIKINIIIN